MTKAKKESFFWTSYSDLMTTLFFIMLVLFVLAIALLSNNIKKVNTEKEATEARLEKVREIEEATHNIDTAYFEYKEEYKKHILKIQTVFPKDRYEEKYISSTVKKELINAGKSITKFLNDIDKKHPDVKYLLVIEGQASKDKASDLYNYQLSYLRAYTLGSEIWKDLDFGSNCEVLISGSGIGGTMREVNESDNQRFLIHIIPKPGMIEDANK